jgi:prevent-host-death family protein
MTFQGQDMTTSPMTRSVSVTEFKAHCLDMIRQVEADGRPVDLVRRGRVVARLVPTPSGQPGVPPWRRLLGTGRLEADPGESVLDARDFEAAR